MLEIELYWSFRSPYSYLVLPRLIALEEEYNLRIDVRPVYPLAIRTPEFFEQRHPLWFSYFMRDVHREAEFIGMPFRWPVPDPVVMNPMTRSIPTEQPYIYPVTRLGVAAVEAGRGLPFLRAASHLIWSGEADQWHQSDHLQRVTESVGLDWVKLLATAEQEAERLDQVIEANQKDQLTGGHYGVPLMVFRGEPFFGQDRFDQLKWRLLKAGMTQRSGVLGNT